MPSVESGHRKTKENIIPRGKFRPLENDPKGRFPLGGIFRAERHFLLFKDQLAESGRQKTKENIIPRGKFLLVENDPKGQLAESGRQKAKDNIVPRGKFRLVENGPKAIFHLVEFSARSDIFLLKGRFLLGGIFRTERHFLLCKDQLAESGRPNLLIPALRIDQSDLS